MEEANNIAKKLNQSEVSNPMSSNGFDPLKISDPTTSNVLETSNDDDSMYIEDDCDDDCDDECDDDNEYAFDYNDYDASDDDYSTLQSQFDNIDVPSGVEASLPWLKDNPTPPMTSSSTASTSAPPPSSSSNSTKKVQDNNDSRSTDQIASTPAKPNDDDSNLEFKNFDAVEDFSDHHYSRMGFPDEQPPKNWAKRIQEEWRVLENGLPESIFVRVYEERMELLRAVIIGPPGTPYHDGLFVFDCLFPTDYPNSPPTVYYYSGGLRLNPNLYDNGKVCLSLLGTWSGSARENWIPNESTMLQVLVSIQALILNADPFFNEPGYDQRYTGPEGQAMSRKYSEDAFLMSLKTMMYTLRKPPRHFEGFVSGHFRRRGRSVLEACKGYCEGRVVGSGGGGDGGGGHRSSKELQSSLGRIMNMLVTNFAKNGSTDCEQFRVGG